MKRVNLVTSLRFIENGWDKESQILLNSLEQRDIKCNLVAWDDPQIDWSNADLNIIRTTWDYYIQVPAFLIWTRRVEESSRLWNSSKVIQWNSNKKYLTQLQDSNVPVPPTIFLKQGSKIELQELIEDTDWEEIIIKPATSVGAWGAKRFHRDSTEAQGHLDNVLIHGYEHLNARDGKVYNIDSGDGIIQKFIPEIMTSGETSMIYFGGVFSHSVKKMPKMGDFRIHDVYGGQVLAYDASDDERRVAERGLDCLGMETQYARIDTVLTDKGPLIIEMELIEPRLFFEYYPETAESYADHIENYLKE